MSPWRVVKRQRPEGEPGRVVMRVSSAEASTQRLTAEWVGEGEPPERKPDAVPLSLPRPGNGDLACAWADYRADYDVPSGVDIKVAHALFRAGWEAHRDGDQRGVLR